MPNDERTFPPRPGRMAAAVRAGLLMRSETLIAGATLLICAGTLAAMSDHFAIGIGTLIESGIQRAFKANPDPIAALKSSFWVGVTLLAPLLGASLVAGLLGALVPKVFQPGSSGRTAIPLPKAPRTGIASTVLRSFGALLLVLISSQVIKSVRGDLAIAMTGDLSVGPGIWSGFAGLLAAGGAVMMLVGLAEQAINFHVLWNSLHLTKFEAKREQRAAGGNQETKSAGLRRHRKEVVR